MSHKISKGCLLHSQIVVHPASNAEGTVLFDAAHGVYVGVVEPVFANVFAATSIVHKAMQTHLNSLERLCGLLEDAGHSEFAATLASLQADLNVVQRTALEGTESIVAEAERNKRHG